MQRLASQVLDRGEGLDLLINNAGVMAVLGLVTRFAAQPAARGALPVLRAATDPQAHGGDYYGPGELGEGRGAPRKVRYTKTAHDEQLASRLWQASEALTGVTFPGPAGHAGPRPSPADPR